MVPMKIHGRKGFEADMDFAFTWNDSVKQLKLAVVYIGMIGIGIGTVENGLA